MPDGSAFPAWVKAAFRRGNALTQKAAAAQVTAAQHINARDALYDELRTHGVQIIDIAEAWGVSESALRKTRNR